MRGIEEERKGWDGRSGFGKSREGGRGLGRLVIVLAYVSSFSGRGSLGWAEGVVFRSV